MTPGKAWSTASAVAVATTVALVLIVSSESFGSSAPSASSASAPGATARSTEASCATGGTATTRVSAKRDAVLGPLVLIGGRGWATAKPDAFNRRGYKVPATLPLGVRATLSVPAAMRGHVGLVFSLATQDRVVKGGVRKADVSVRFSACPASGEPGRTGWPGGLVVDRPRCVTLVVKVSGSTALRRRVPLGRRC